MTTLCKKLEKLRENIMAVSTADLAPFPVGVIGNVSPNKKKKLDKDNVQKTKELNSEHI